MSQRARRIRIVIAWTLLVGAIVGWPLSMLTVARDEPPFVLSSPGLRSSSPPPNSSPPPRSTRSRASRRGSSEMIEQLARAVRDLFHAAPTLAFTAYTLEPKWQSTICLSWVGLYDDEGFHGPRDGIALGIGQRGFAVIWG